MTFLSHQTTTPNFIFTEGLGKVCPSAACFVYCSTESKPCVERTNFYIIELLFLLASRAGTCVRAGGDHTCHQVESGFRIGRIESYNSAVAKFA